MEIGTARGGTLYIWARYLDSVSKLISLDLPGDKFGRGYSKHRVPFYDKFDSGKDKEMIFVREKFA